MRVFCVCHNTPYPPNKGDKIRAFHLLRELSAKHEVHLLALAKDPQDVAHKQALEQYCASVTIIPLHPVFAKVYALLCLVVGLPLTLGFFFSLKAKRAAARICREHSFDAALAVCSSTAHYLNATAAEIKVVDFVDIDSEKWGQYADIHQFPKSLLYWLEHKRLGKVEAAIHAQTTVSLVTSDIEKQRLMRLARVDGSRILVIPQGVDLPFYGSRQVDEIPGRIVFTGQMDYLPNIDGVLTFYQQVLPKIKSMMPEVTFAIVGRNPDSELQQLCPDAIITGEVGDIRTHLHAAAVVVAPLRLAFGMQSKILEAMASGIPVVASDKAAQSLWAIHGEEILVAHDPETFAQYVTELLLDRQEAQRIGSAGRNYVGKTHEWSEIVHPLLQLLDELPVSNGYEQIPRETGSEGSVTRKTSEMLFLHSSKGDDFKQRKNALLADNS